MRRGLAGAVLAVVVTAASGCAHSDGHRHAGAKGTRFATPRPSGSGWNYAYVSPSTGRALEHVVATGPADAWAAGNARGAPLLMHYDGRGWRDHGLPDDARGFGIRALAASAPDNVWVFGENQGERAWGAWRWDGSHWSDAHLDTAHGLTDAAVLGPGDVWIVRGDRTSLHWDGHGWRKVPLPARATAISAVTAHDIWAVGSVATQGEQMSQPAATHWNGHAWTLVPTPTFHFPDPVPPEATAGLNDVLALAPNDAWAIGEHTFNHGEVEDEPPEPPPIFLHWDGARWTKQPIPTFSLCCQRLARDGAGRILLTSGSSWQRAPDGRFTRLTGPPAFTGLRGRTKLFLQDVANVPGTTSLWGVGGIEHNEAGNPWGRAAIVRYG